MTFVDLRLWNGSSPASYRSVEDFRITAGPRRNSWLRCMSAGGNKSVLRGGALTVSGPRWGYLRGSAPAVTGAINPL